MFRLRVTARVVGSLLGEGWIGRIWASAGAAQPLKTDGTAARIPGGSTHHLNLAQAFFDRINNPTPFASTHSAENLLHLGRATEAARVLDAVPQGRREKHWMHRRSETYFKLGEMSQALACINDALGTDDVRQFRTTFLRQRAEIRRQMNDPACIDDLLEAVATVDSEQFRETLERTIADWKAHPLPAESLGPALPVGVPLAQRLVRALRAVLGTLRKLFSD